MRYWRLTRLALHLLVGLGKVALLFPLLSAAGRERRVQRWSRQLVAICGVSMRFDQSLQAAPVSPALIICNHISWLDIFVINTLQPCRFVAKSDIRSWPLIGWLCEHTGTIFIARGRARDVRRIYEGLVKSIHDGERLSVDVSTLDPWQQLPAKSGVGVGEHEHPSACALACGLALRGFDA